MIAVVVGIIVVLIATAVLWGLARKNRKKREAEEAAAEASAASENGEDA